MDVFLFFFGGLQHVIDFHRVYDEWIRQLRSEVINCNLQLWRREIQLIATEQQTPPGRTLAAAQKDQKSWEVAAVLGTWFWLCPQ